MIIFVEKELKMDLKDMLTWTSVGIQGFAAILWFSSTVVKVSAKKVEDEYQKIHGLGSGPFQMVSEDGSDFNATLVKQAMWNRWAALVTGIGIGIQAIATALPNSN